MSFTLGKGFFLVFCIITEEERPLKLLVENSQDWYCLRLKALWEPVNYVDGRSQSFRILLCSKIIFFIITWLLVIKFPNFLSMFST